MTNILNKALFCLSALAFATSASAITQTAGSGSAVSVVGGVANFEDIAALSGTYTEGGMSFSRTGLTDNNNGCGYAGCVGHSGFAGFTGNYMYGTGSGYFTISALNGNDFYGLEFQVGSGFSVQSTDVQWTAFDDGIQVGSGVVSGAAVGSVIGFVDAAGFDELRYTDTMQFGLNAPAFDSVRAQFTPSASAVPEPASYGLALAGLATVGLIARRRRAAV